MELSQEQWQSIQQGLAAPFKPEQVNWRPQGKAGPNQRVQVLAYFDARDIQTRLDEVVGAGYWRSIGCPS